MYVLIKVIKVMSRSLSSTYTLVVGSGLNWWHQKNVSYSYFGFLAGTAAAGVDLILLAFLTGVVASGGLTAFFLDFFLGIGIGGGARAEGRKRGSFMSIGGA